MECSFDATVFSKNRQRILDHDARRALFDEEVWSTNREGLPSDEHFSVDRTLIGVAASLKSFWPKDKPLPPTTNDDPGSPSVDLREERRSNEAHASATDPGKRLLCKGGGKEAKLAFLGHAQLENRYGLLMDFPVSLVAGTASCSAVPELLDRVWERNSRPRTLGTNCGNDTRTSWPQFWPD